MKTRQSFEGTVHLWIFVEVVGINFPDMGWKLIIPEQGFEREIILISPNCDLNN
jgi:hypothetical protein